MRQLILILSISLLTNLSNGQCNCQKIKRDDGAVITQCPALPVSSDSKTEIGLSIASNGTSTFLCLTIRFVQGAIQQVQSKITLRLDDNNLFSVDLMKSEPSYIGNSPVTNAIFKIDATNILLLKKSSIKTISFKLPDNMLYTYIAKMNSDIVIKQLNCL